MSTRVISREPSRTHEGCFVLRVEERVGSAVVIATLVTNPANQGRRDAEDELLNDLANKVAKEKWRQAR